MRRRVAPLLNQRLHRRRITFDVRQKQFPSPLNRLQRNRQLIATLFQQNTMLTRYEERFTDDIPFMTFAAQYSDLRSNWMRL